VATSLIQHHSYNERNNWALHAISPESYSISMEVGDYDQEITPKISLDLKIRLIEYVYSLATTTK